MLQVVLEEFGKWVKNTTAATQTQRQSFYSLAYSIVQQAISPAEALHLIS